MTVILAFTISGDSSALGRVLPRDVRAELDRVVPLSDTWLPYLWVHGDGDAYDALETALDADDAVDDVTCVDAFDDRRLYRIDWATVPDGVLADLDAAGGALLGAVGTADAWEFEARFPDQDGLSAFNDDCVATNDDVEVTGVYRPDPTSPDRFGLTDGQRDALVAALDAGFYNIPRDTTTVELAGELGVSDQSLSERLRRAHSALVESTLR
ncbi:helix-turn-helix domain-containing protein [Halocalculus aciditolerans]|uniref:Bacteriocin n=1 Tax=Halocalculus aciditolerans TaxID=1383812 RepID=A0A830FGN0_9EURY|nr:helix-turn-helix domain-containing protein [Halocalculus aciditolerans]GGL50996.1 bacteriocin [Halocalculus aciditolerans]